jgi:hypothetical protein
MRRALFLVIAAALIFLLIPAAGAVDLTINATPQTAQIGDVIKFHGTVTGINTIAVYLFLGGPSIDSRGVTLENLNMPAGRGLFTTAPVNLSDGTWSYRWDTSVILGTLEPGTYTVYVVSSPVDRLRFSREDYATTDITIRPGEGTPTESPLDPMLPMAAVGIAVTAMVLIARTRGKKE